MANFTDTNILQIECGVFTVTNDTGSDQVLHTRKLIGNTLTKYEYEDIDTIDIAIDETITLTIPDSESWNIYYESDVDDTAYLFNLCAIDSCIIELTRSLTCTNCCDDCVDLCNDMKKIKTYMQVSLLYEILQDVLDINFNDTPKAWYPSLSLTMNKAYSIYEIIQKITELCSCKTC